MGSLELASRSNRRSDRSTVSVAGPSTASLDFLTRCSRGATFPMFHLLKHRFKTVPRVLPSVKCRRWTSRAARPVQMGGNDRLAEIWQPKKGKGARDHLLTLFGFDGWLGQRKQQKRHRPA